MIDAGSSGSRIQIYSWLDHALSKDLRLADNLPLSVLPRVEPGVQQGDEWQLKVSPGISTFGSSPDQVGAYLQPLLDRAMDIIPPQKRDSTPIFLLATAGMRLLPTDQQEAVLSQTCDFFRSHSPFVISSCKDHVRIISGEEEGIFGWTAVNYLLDGFDHHHDEDSGKAKGSTFGFLDMGGASAQIAFEPSPEERSKHANDLFDISLRHLDGQSLSHPVFVTTWLGYGTNQARDRYIDMLSSSSSSSSGARIPDPCLPKDLSMPLADDKALQGTGDFAECLHTLSPLLNKEAPCPDAPCLFAGVHVPEIDFAVNHFIGISEYWYSTNEIFQLGGIYDFVQFEKAAQEYCASTWQDILDAKIAGTDMSRLQMQCFKSAWLVNMLHKGIGIPRLTDDYGHGDRKPHWQSALEQDDKGFVPEDGVADRPAYFQSLNAVNNVAVSWTLGKMVLEVAASIPERREGGGDAAWLPSIDFDLHDLEQMRPSLNSFTRPSFFHVLIVLLLFGLLFFCFKRRRPSFPSLGGAFSPSRRRNASDIYDLESLEAGESISSPIAKQRLSEPFGGSRPTVKMFSGTVQRWANKLSSALGRSPYGGLPHHHQLTANGSILGERSTSPSAFAMRPRPLRHAQSSPALSNKSVLDRVSSEQPQAGSSSRDSGDLPRISMTASSRSSSPRMPFDGYDTDVVDLQAAGQGIERSVTPLSRLGGSSSVRLPSRNPSSSNLAQGFTARRAIVDESF